MLYIREDHALNNLAALTGIDRASSPTALAERVRIMDRRIVVYHDLRMTFAIH